MDAHWDGKYGGFAWLLDRTDIADGTKYCYGHSFAVLTLAMAKQSGVDCAAEHLETVVEFVDERVWEPDCGLCLTECSRDWEQPRPYRGQNANMHMCEAALTAYEATGDDAHLERASSIAEAIGRRFLDQGDGLVWEHYDEDWNHDWEYNVDVKDTFFRPWRYLSGHQVEWTKFLLLFERYVDEDWLVDRARHLFDYTLDVAWNETRGGIDYTFDRDGEILIDEKFYWVMTEAFSSAALLADRTGNDGYWDWYEWIWSYSENQLVNKELGI
jgi:mannose/cellobiose epimerase-like protein (N-acyl-D-glucosamine 2-epimerase family)